jgi:hypothetical protein
MSSGWKEKIVLTTPEGLKTISELGEIHDISAIKQYIGRIGLDLVIKKSKSIPNENGVFTKRPYQKNEIITFYDGKIIRYHKDLPEKLFTHAKDFIFSRYSLLGNVNPNHSTEENLNHYATISSDDVETLQYMGGGAFINHSSFDPNVIFFHIDTTQNEWKANPIPSQRLLCGIAKTDILPDTELFVDYGKSYWAKKICSSKPHRMKRKIKISRSSFSALFIVTKRKRINSFPFH